MKELQGENAKRVFLAHKDDNDNILEVVGLRPWYRKASLLGMAPVIAMSTGVGHCSCLRLPTTRDHMPLCSYEARIAMRQHFLSMFCLLLSLDPNNCGCLQAYIILVNEETFVGMCLGGFGMMTYL